MTQGIMFFFLELIQGPSRNLVLMGYRFSWVIERYIRIMGLRSTVTYSLKIPALPCLILWLSSTSGRADVLCRHFSTKSWDPCYRPTPHKKYSYGRSSQKRRSLGRWRFMVP